MNKLYTFTFILIISGYAGYAQKRFTKSHIVQLNGDTLNGFIQYNNWNKSPRSITFSRQIAEQTSQDFSAEDIKEFSIFLTNNSETYTSLTLPLDTSANNLHKLNENPEPEFDNPTTFFGRQITRGFLTLLEHKDSRGKTHYFIQPRDKSAIALIYKPYLNRKDNLELAYNRKFKTQLFELFGDCPLITSKNVRDLMYDDHSLSKIVREYNVWSEGRTQQNQEVFTREPVKIKFGVTMGLSGHSVRINKEERKQTASSVFSGGVNVNLIIPRMKEKLSVANEFLFQAYEGKAIETSRNNGVYMPTNLNKDFNFQYLRINTMINYVISKGLISPFINAGLSNSIALKKGYFTNDPTPGPNPSYTSIDIRGYEQGLIAGIGVKVKRVALQTRFENTNGFSSYMGLVTSVNNYYCLISYTL